MYALTNLDNLIFVRHDIFALLCNNFYWITNKNYLIIENTIDYIHSHLLHQWEFHTSLSCNSCWILTHNFESDQIKNTCASCRWVMWMSQSDIDFKSILILSSCPLRSTWRKYSCLDLKFWHLNMINYRILTLVPKKFVFKFYSASDLCREIIRNFELDKYCSWKSRF